MLLMVQLSKHELDPHCTAEIRLQGCMNTSTVLGGYTPLENRGHLSQMEVLGASHWAVLLSRKPCRSEDTELETG
jgi:hypothetical protein